MDWSRIDREKNRRVGQITATWFGDRAAVSAKWSPTLQRVAVPVDMSTGVDKNDPLPSANAMLVILP